MKRYIIAVINTLITLITPLIYLPFLEWYKIKFNITSNLEGYYMLMVIISLIMIVITIINWIATLRNKSIEELLK